MVSRNICTFFIQPYSCIVKSVLICQDLNFIKIARSIRTPFRNTEIMTSRGFGKRNGEDGLRDLLAESKQIALFLLIFIEKNSSERASQQQNNEDYRDEVVTNLIRQKQLLFPFNNNQFLKNPPPFKEEFVGQDNSVPVVKNHRLQIRDGTLKFRLNDGSLRTARGFGKRSGFVVDPVLEK